MPATLTPALVADEDAFLHERGVNVETTRHGLQHVPASYSDVTGCDRRTGQAYFLTTDPDSGNEVADLAAAHGLRVQTLFPKEGLPREATALFVALDELLHDAHGRRQHLDQLKQLRLPYQVVVVSYDFQLEPVKTERPGLLLTTRLGEEVFAALGYCRIGSCGATDLEPAA